MEPDAMVVARLRAAGCVFAEEEALVLAGAAETPAGLAALVERRVGGLPLEHVVGWAEFCGQRIFVDPGVFVPRRRSEFLVRVAAGLNAVVAAGQAADGRRGPLVVDLCCGTGALGLAVAAQAGLGLRGGGDDDGDGPGMAELHAADLDPAAVACARRNVEPAGGHVYAGDLFGPLPASLRGRVNILLCNAPYVPSAEVAYLPAEAREHEALIALDGGSDGLAVLRRAAAQAPGWLAPGGTLLVEASDRQAAGMAAAMAGAGLSPAIHADGESGATVVTGTMPAP